MIEVSTTSTNIAIDNSTASRVFPPVVAGSLIVVESPPQAPAASLQPARCRQPPRPDCPNGVSWCAVGRGPHVRTRTRSRSHILPKRPPAVLI